MARPHLLFLPLCLAGCHALDPEPTSGELRDIWSRIGSHTGRPEPRPRPAAPAPTGAGADPAPAPAAPDPASVPPPPKDIPSHGADWMPVDLPAALQLAGENNLTIRIAASAVAEAEAAELQAFSRFLPLLQPGYTFTNHEGTSQKTEGNIIRANRNAERLSNRTLLVLNPSRAYFESLQARRVRRAGDFAAQAVQNDIGLLAAQQYFDMVRALRQVAIAKEFLLQAEELVRINQDRMDKGVGLRVDLTRAEARSAEARQFLDETTAGFRIAGIRLANTLQLPPDVALYPAGTATTPIEFVGKDVTLGTLLDAAAEANPTLKEQAMLVSAAEKAAAAAVWEPFVPRLGVEANNGAFGNRHDFGGSQDYAVGVFWEFEGLGLGNLGRVKAAQARLRSTELRAEDVRRRLLALVAEGHQEIDLQRTNIGTAARQVRAAEESFQLAENRLKGGIGLFLDVLDAQSQLTRARVAELSAVIEFNKAQYRLFNRLGNRAVATPP